MSGLARGQFISWISQCHGPEISEMLSWIGHQGNEKLSPVQCPFAASIEK